MQNYFYNGGMMGGWGWSGPGWMYSLAPLFVLWSLTWKGLALWHAAGRKQGWWFIALLVFNTAGILEIIYLFGVLKLKTNALFPGKK